MTSWNSCISNYKSQSIHKKSTFNWWVAIRVIDRRLWCILLVKSARDSRAARTRVHFPRVKYIKDGGQWRVLQPIYQVFTCLDSAQGGAAEISIYHGSKFEQETWQFQKIFERNVYGI